MRTIFKIAKNELRYLFYSPIAWFLAIIMLVLAGVRYTNYMYFYSRVFTIYRKYTPEIFHGVEKSMTMELFNNLFGSLLGQLYLFVPFLTMGVINREFSNETFKLLYSSPVKLRQIVLGKYLAMLLYCFFLVAICGIFILLGMMDIKGFDAPLTFSGLLGMFLLLSAFTAIGFFMSSLTNYQIVAAIASFTVLFLLNGIGGLWQQYDFIRDITWFLSISGRSAKMLEGLITSKDIIYYCVIMFMFVAFTYQKLKDGQETKPWYIKIARYCCIVLIGLGVGYFSARPGMVYYWDTTAQQMNTVHPKTQQFLQQLDEGPLEVTLYTNILEEGAADGLPAARNSYLTDLWERYQRFKSDIHFNYEYYYGVSDSASARVVNIYSGKSLKQIAGLVAREMEVDSAIFKPVSRLKDSAILASENYKLLMILRYKDREVVLRVFPGTPTEPGLSTWPSQQNVNAALINLLGIPTPKVHLVTGQLERSIYKKGEREFFQQTINKGADQSLINNGFEIDTLNLSIQNIPDGTTTLVLADPKMALPEIVSDKLKRYIQSGGNMIVLGEPGKQYVLNPLLHELGIQLQPGQLVQRNAEETPDKLTGYLTATGLNLADEKLFLHRKHIWSLGMYKDSTWVEHTGVTSLAVADSNSFDVKPLLMTSPHKAWLKAGKLVVDSVAPVFHTGEGDRREVSSSIGLQLTRKLNRKEQRIIVAGDADFFSNLRGQLEVIRAFYSWSSDNQFPVYTPYPYAEDNQILLSPERAIIQRHVFSWVLPALVLIFASVLLIRRKRK